MLWLLCLAFVRIFSFEAGPFVGRNVSLFRDVVNLPTLGAAGLTVIGKTEPGCTFTFCLQHLVMPLPSVSVWTHCAVFNEFAEGSTNVTQHIPPGYYHIAMMGTEQCVMQVLLTGTDCPASQYFIDGKCQATQLLPSAGYVLNSGEQITFQASIDQPFPYALAATAEFISPGAEGWLMLLARERDVPQRNEAGVWIFDWNSTAANTTLITQINLPRAAYSASEPTVYFFTLVNPSPLNITLSSVAIKPYMCPFRPDTDQPVGMDCVDTGLVTAKKLSVVSHNEVNMNTGWWYGVYSVNGGPMSVGVTNLTEKDLLPALYFRYGNIPTQDVYDMIVPPSSNATPTFYSTDSTANGTWFVGMMNDAPHLRGIWFNAECPIDEKQQECSGEGDCVDHTCVCKLGFTYICSPFLPVSPTPGPPGDEGQKFWWVLGVIGSVFLAAILFFLCKYRRDNRKRHRDYLTMPRASQEGAIKKRTYDSMTVGAL